MRLRAGLAFFAKAVTPALLGSSRPMAPVSQVGRLLTHDIQARIQLMRRTQALRRVSGESGSYVLTTKHLSAYLRPRRRRRH